MPIHHSNQWRGLHLVLGEAWQPPEEHPPLPQPPPAPIVNDREGASMARPLRHDARVSEEMQRLRDDLDALALEPEPSHLTHPSSTPPTQRGSRGGVAVRGGRRVSGAPARPQRTSRPAAPVTGLRFDNVLALEILRTPNGGVMKE